MVVGDVVRLTATFTNAAGTLADPTVVTLEWRVGTTTTTWVYGTDDEVVKDSTGVYHADLPIEVASRHYYLWTGTGAVQAAEENSFRVDASVVAP
jgi:hypothetical protein